MEINNDFKLFFCTSIRDYRYSENRPIPLIFEILESIADHSLSSIAYLLKGRIITLKRESYYTYTRPILMEDPLIFKVILVAISTLCFIPSVLIKAFVWALYRHYIRERNQTALEALKKSIPFRNVHVIQPKQSFQASYKQIQPFNKIPKELFHKIISCLTEQELAFMALTSTENYDVTSRFSQDSLRQCHDYPGFAIQALGKEQLAPLPFFPLNESWINFIDYCSSQDRYLWCRRLSLPTIEKNKEFYDSMFFKLENETPYPPHSVQKIQLRDHQGLMIQIKDNLLRKKQVFLICQINSQRRKQLFKQWRILSPNLSPMIRLFLEDISWSRHQDIPQVINYLQRLFRKEPCGNFSDASNPDHIIYPDEKASSILQEGPRFCPDGLTPVVQLC